VAHKAGLDIVAQDRVAQGKHLEVVAQGKLLKVVGQGKLLKVVGHMHLVALVHLDLEGMLLPGVVDLGHILEVVLAQDIVLGIVDARLEILELGDGQHKAGDTLEEHALEEHGQLDMMWGIQACQDRFPF